MVAVIKRLLGQSGGPAYDYVGDINERGQRHGKGRYTVLKGKGAGCYYEGCAHVTVD